MKRDLSLAVNLDSVTISDLQADLRIINATSGETLIQIVERKETMISLQVGYYLDLVNVIAEGMALGVLN
jgi:hypothetical protein